MASSIGRTSHTGSMESHIWNAYQHSERVEVSKQFTELSKLLMKGSFFTIEKNSQDTQNCIQMDSQVPRLFQLETFQAKFRCSI